MSSLSIGGLTALSWTLTGITIALTTGRFIIRQKTAQKLQWDDAFHGLSLLLLTALIATYTAGFPFFYKIEFFMAGKGPVPSLSEFNRYSHFQTAISLIWWSCIYSVKFSFLMFYRMIFGVSRNFMKAWWAVAVFTFLTFWACFGGVFATCGRASDLFKPEYCTLPSMVILQTSIVEYWCILNILSDLAIMALPLYMLKGLQISQVQKMTLACLFCLAFIDIVFDILRTFYTVRGGPVAFWDILEAEVAVIISCLPTYRALLTTARKRSAKSYQNLVPNKSGKANQNRASPGFRAPNSEDSKNFSQQSDSVGSAHIDTWPADIPRPDTYEAVQIR